MTHNSAELLARILALKLLPLHIPSIIIYDSQVVHDLHHNLTSTSYTARHLTRSLYPSISRSLAHRLHHIANKHITPYTYAVLPHTYFEHITTEILNTIRNLPCSTDWQPRHLTSIHQHTYIKIKSHELQQNGHPDHNRKPQPCLALAHANHWTDITADIPTKHRPYPHFPCLTSNHHIRSPLLYYGLYPIDSDVSVFMHQLY